MKITLSKKDDPRGRHCVLVCDHSEGDKVWQVVAQDILENKARPVREQEGRGPIIYRFNLKYLDRLALAFPFAELSPGVHKRLKRAEEVRLEGFRIPELEIPGFTGKLYDFQKIAVGLLTDPDYARECGYNGVELDPDSALKLHHPGGVVDFLNDEMGLGKTYVILATIAILQAYPAIVMVPNNAKYTWLEVIEEFYPDLSVAVYDTQEQSPAEREAILRERRDITIVNIEAIRAKAIHENDDRYAPIIGYDYANPALFDFTYEYAVLDEHHKVKTPGAQVTNGFMQIQAEDWWCPMSGTPILNRVEEWWTVLHKLYPDLFPSYDRFVRLIGTADADGRIVAYKPRAMAELKLFLADRTIRRRKDQVLKDMPEVVYKPVRVVLSTEERRLYQQIEDELVMEMEDGTVKNIGGALPQITRMKQACFSPELFGGAPISSKVEELKKIVSELVASGEKAIIFSQWETACQILKRELSEWNPAYVTGKIRTKLRHEEQRRFNEDDTCHLYIGTIDANREAINLGVATYVIFTDEGWTPAGNDQAIGRSAAGGLRGAAQKAGTVVTVIIMQAEDTYEQNVEALLKKKRAIFDRTVERDAGKGRKIERVTLNDLRKALSKKGQKKAGKVVKSKSAPKESRPPKSTRGTRSNKRVEF